MGQNRSMTRRKHIYYDTDGISEEQEETVLICEDCGGMVTIDSEADTGRHIFAVMVPYLACPRCRQAGEKAFDQADHRRFSTVYFQDKDRDLFQVK